MAMRTTKYRAPEPAFDDCALKRARYEAPALETFKGIKPWAVGCAAAPAGLGAPPR